MRPWPGPLLSLAQLRTYKVNNPDFHRRQGSGSAGWSRDWSMQIGGCVQVSDEELKKGAAKKRKASRVG